MDKISCKSPKKSYKLCESIQYKVFGKGLGENLFSKKFSPISHRTCIIFILGWIQYSIKVGYCQPKSGNLLCILTKMKPCKSAKLLWRASVSEDCCGRDSNPRSVISLPHRPQCVLPTKGSAERYSPLFSHTRCRAGS